MSDTPPPALSARRGGSWWIEAGFLAAILVSVYYTWSYFRAAGHLPSPYYHSVIDTFMDWINVAYWANNPGAYYSYLSVYPPLSFAFTRLFSIHSCYRFDNIFARDCDFTAEWVLASCFVLNAFLVFKAFARIDRRTAWIRTLALTFGLPMLYGIERGQLLIPCFTFFILAHGRIVSSARLRWLCTAITINFKPYLIFTIVPHVLRRRWTAVEGCILAGLGVYLITWAIVGVGTPQEIISNILGYDALPLENKFDNVFYQMTYKPLIDSLQSRLPLMFYLGSEPMRLIETWVPVLIRLGQLGIVACFVGAAFRPKAVPMHRLTLLSVLLITTSSMTGGYTQFIVFFLVFMEPWKGPARITALVIAYLLSISVDHQIMTIVKEVLPSWLSGRMTEVDLGVSVGELARPGFILVMEYALIAQSLSELLRARPAAAPGPAPARRIDPTAAAA